MITVTCECGRQSRLRPEAAGKRLQCPDCGEMIDVPKAAPRRKARPGNRSEEPRRRPRDEPAARRGSGNPAKRAIAKVQREMQSYRHETCGTDMTVSDDFLELAALDPWYFPIGSAECAGCGSARTCDSTLDDGRTVHEAFMELRRSVPTAGVMMRFVIIPVIGLVLGALVGAILAVVKVGNGNPAGIFVGAAAVGLVGGYFAIKPLFKELRRMGAFW